MVFAKGWMSSCVTQILRYQQSGSVDVSQMCFGYSSMCEGGKGYLFQIWGNLGGYGRLERWDDGVGDAQGGTWVLGEAGEKWQRAVAGQSRSYPLSRGPLPPLNCSTHILWHSSSYCPTFSRAASFYKKVLKAWCSVWKRVKITQKIVTCNNFLKGTQCKICYTR